MKQALVIDDNPLNSRLVEVLLKRLGWQVEIASDGESGLQRLKARRPDLVFLDLRMPRLSGEEVCRRIRELPGMNKMAIYAYTANGMPEERARILAAGFDGLLVKPVSFGDVRAVCERVSPSGPPA